LVAAGFSLRRHRLESLCYQLTAKWYDLLAVTNLAYQREKALFPTKEGLFDIVAPLRGLISQRVERTVGGTAGSH